MATLEEILVEMAHENREVLERIATLEETNRDLLTLAEYNAKKDYEIVFFTYPYDGTRATLSAGTTTIDFAQGTIRSPTGTITKLSTDLGKKKKDFLRSVTINANEDIIIQLDENNKIPVRANNWFTETYQQFTRVKITTTASTDTFVLASTNPKAVLDMVGERTITTPLAAQPWTAVAQNTIVKSEECDLLHVGDAILYIQAALNTTTPHTGTRFIVETSASPTGDKDWYPLTDFVALIGTATADATENALAVDDTDITLTGHALTVEGILLFIEDATLANSEIGMQASQTTNQVKLLDGVSNAHIMGTAIFNIAMAVGVTLPSSAMRARLVVDNTYDEDGSTLDYKADVLTANEE